MKLCFKCRRPVAVEKISFREECPQCRADLHVCLNCVFYDEGKANKCREPQADYVKERDKANYCEYFSFKDDQAKKSAKEEAEKLWENIFKKTDK
jgi:hypothetical protein